MLRHQGLSCVAASESAASRLASLQISQKRYRRTMAYPSYSHPGNIPESSSKKPVTRRLMNEFLGHKNYKGIYWQSKYAYPKLKHQPNYINPSSENGAALLPGMKKITASSSREDALNADVDNEGDSKGLHRNETGEGSVEENPLLAQEEEEDSSEGITEDRMRDPLQPFPNNPSCLTNTVISREMKEEIISLYLNEHQEIPKIAASYGLKIQRIEAIIRLGAIEKKWREENKVTHELNKMSNVMYQMFPLYDPSEFAENLTEIPIPKEASESRFLTIAESEPFGPIDAANALGLEPAVETLRKLSEVDGSVDSKISNKRINFKVPVKDNSKIHLQFTDVKVGDIGYRYGKSYRDTKKSRRIGYDANGKMTYLL